MKGGGRTEVLGSGGVKETEVSGNKEAWDPEVKLPARCQSQRSGVAADERPRLYNRRGTFCPQEEDRIHHGAADRRTIDHALWKSERSLRTSFDSTSASGRDEINPAFTSRAHG